jgi:hypothetical protein
MNAPELVLHNGMRTDSGGECLPAADYFAVPEEEIRGIGLRQLCFLIY